MTQVVMDMVLGACQGGVKGLNQPAKMEWVAVHSSLW